MDGWMVRKVSDIGWEGAQWRGSNGECSVTPGLDLGVMEGFVGKEEDLVGNLKSVEMASHYLQVSRDGRQG